MNCAKINNYNPNILFSSISGTNVLGMNITEYKTVKSGLYKRLLKSYYSTYDSKGEKSAPSNLGNFFDEVV